MIRLSNGHEFEYMVASGSLGFDGKGWLWDKPLILFGFIDPRLFTLVLRTITLKPKLYPVSNLSWIRPWTWLPWSQWSCVRFLKNGGAVNKVGLYNKGFEQWHKKVVPRLDFYKVPLVASFFGTESELVEMASRINPDDFVAVELNVSCPNANHADETTTIIRSVKAVKAKTTLPIIVKVSVAQDFLAIAQGLEGIAEAISFNSVPWKIAFPNGEQTPLAKLEKKVGGGGGGVSGKPAQKYNWAALEKLARQGSLPVIASSVMEYEDLKILRDKGASAFSFGAIHLRTPWKPTSIVRREQDEHE